MPDADFQKFASQIAVNPPGSYEGPAIASAAAITLSHPVHKISGVAAISTINPPFTGFVGHVTLIPTGAWTLATGANVAVARTAVPNVAMRLYYDGSTWYPSSAA
jgi:hypothetical protein